MKRVKWGSVAFWAAYFCVMLALSAEAQGSFWVLVNGALMTSRRVVVGSLQVGAGGPIWTNSSGNLAARNAADSAFTSVRALGFNGAANATIISDTDWRMNGIVLMSATAPTVSSGFGTSPSIANNNGTTAFTINVGTGGTATAGVVGLPTATTGWICHVSDVTAAAAHVAYNTRQTASTTASATLENQTTSTGTAIAWAASDVLRVSCFAY